MRRIGVVICAVLGLALAVAASASAVTPVTCAGLAPAINSANAGDVLQLPPGVCKVNLTIANTAAFTLEGATSGGTTTLEPVTATDPIISSLADVRFTLKGLAFTGDQGNAVSLQGPGEAATIEGNTFTGNTRAAGFGAAVTIQTFAAGVTTQPTVIAGNTFSGNSADGGGAIALLQSGIPLVISGNTFTGNSGTGGGGGVYIASDKPSSGVQVTGNTFGGTGAGAGNTTQDLGGAMFVELPPSEPLTISSNTFQGNKVTGTHTAKSARLGGAVFLGLANAQTPYPVTQANNSFLDNSVDETQAMPTPALPAGGGAEWISGLTVKSSADRFTGNRVAVNDGGPPEGGAVGTFASSPDPPVPAEPAVFQGSDELLIHNSTAAGGWGGAIYVGGPPPTCSGTCPPSTVTLADSTVVSNSVDAGSGSEGGAIWGSPADHLTLQNAIVFGNQPQPELFGFGSAPPAIAFSDACGESGGPPVPGGAGNICADPKLDSSGDETPVSPTLDAGSNGLVPAGLSTDIAGNPRIVANRVGCSGPEPAVVDMGAYEFTGRGPVPPCPPPQLVVDLGHGPWKVNHGHVKIKLSCVATFSFCDGTATLTTVKRFAATARKHKPKRRPLALGKGHFHLSSGASSTISIKLSAKALRRLGSAHSVQIAVSLSFADAAKTAGTVRQTRKLKLAHRHKRKHHR